MRQWYLYRQPGGWLPMYPHEMSLSHGKPIAVGSFDAVVAAARLLGGA